MTANASQAWAILKRHARDEIATLRLQDLCNDNERVSSLVAVHNSTPTITTSTTPTAAAASDGRINSSTSNHHNSMLLVDLSRQRMTLETLNHLLKLSVTRGVRKYISRLAWGQNDPDYPLQNLLAEPGTQTKASGQSNHNNSDNNKHAPHARYQHYANQRKSSNGRKNTDPMNNQHHSSATNNNNIDSNATTKPDFPIIMPSMHLALRAPKDQGLHMLTAGSENVEAGVNVLTSIHREWDRLERLSDAMRRGTWRGATGRTIRDVVVIGRGVSVQALKFINGALEYDEAAIVARKFGLDPNGNGGSTAVDYAGRLIRRGLGGSQQHVPFSPHRRLHFLTSVDPLAAASLVSELDAGSTMVISLALQGNEETGLATKTMKTWLLQQLGGTSASSSQPKVDSILSKHMLLVTGNDQIATNINKPESVFVIPEHSRCEAFLSFSAATLLVGLISCTVSIIQYVFRD